MESAPATYQHRLHTLRFTALLNKKNTSDAAEAHKIIHHLSFIFPLCSVDKGFLM